METPGDDRGLHEAIAETRAAFIAALKDGDAAGASTVYAEDAKMLAPSAELLRGRHVIEEFWSAGLESGVSEVELDVLELQRDDGLAYEIGRYALRLGAENQAVVDRGKYVLVHQRQADGSWRRAVEMFSPDGPPTGGSAS